MHPDLSSIQSARELLRRYLPVTRLVAAPSLSRPSGARVYLKLESDLPTASFKPRGALYALSVNLERRKVREVVASSTGNHGAAVAYAARLLGVPARIFLPAQANPVKRARIAELGAALVEQGRDISEAFQAASACAQRDGIFFLNDATDPDLPAGPATIACEILEQLPQTDAIYVPMGDTALIRGMATAAKGLSPKVRIVGVQAEQAPAYYLSWKENRLVTTDSCDTIADGLATRTPDPQNVQAICELVDDVCLVSEAEMLAAIRHLLIQEHGVAEPAGAAATAAFLKRGKEPGNVVLLVSGANISPLVLRRAIE
ncbi:MAG TPA: pyridoxal-phosphate dependent enzyme [Terriglobales bacterium]|nr:pyridoxal-phosphate dependent enzyme [Terriglobales bacterium]